MNKFVVHAKKGKYPNTKSFYLIEVKPHITNIVKMKHKPNDEMLVLKKWESCYMGKIQESKGKRAERESFELKEALIAGGFESAKALYVTRVFEMPHQKILSILRK